MAASTTRSAFTNTSVREDIGAVTSLPTQADSTVIQVVMTAAHTSTDYVVIPVIIVILLTVTAFGLLLYRYLCLNKGDYRTTGELAPGEDPEEDYSSRDANDKKEYFI